MNKNRKVNLVSASSSSPGKSRRQFLKISGMTLAGTGLLMMGCNNDDDFTRPPDSGVFDLGGGDLGILNYAYALEQLEAEFYRLVLDGSYWAGAAANEKAVLEDIYNHEVIHREVFKTALNSVAPPSQVLPTLEFDFSSVDFGNRDAVLGTAKTLEDTGVGAYNGAGQFLTIPDYLVLAGKIVSVEARHASAIRDIINPGSMDFAGSDILVDIGGAGVAFDQANVPSVVLQAVADTNFIVTPFTTNNLPT